MPEIKTKSGTKERLKLTGSGRIKGRHAFKSHILTKKVRRHKLALAHTTLVRTNNETSVKKQLGLK